MSDFVVYFAHSVSDFVVYFYTLSVRICAVLLLSVRLCVFFYTLSVRLTFHTLSVRLCGLHFTHSVSDFVFFFYTLNVRLTFHTLRVGLFVVVWRTDTRAVGAAAILETKAVLETVAVGGTLTNVSEVPSFTRSQKHTFVGDIVNIITELGQ